ncbi:hypothetical protein LH464_23335 [Neorhizobium sp. T786]|uniref:hypothetical protein n=1 Tax=Pseudorhizobium xiangyangii TaxID=2883104 RepID=UPI001CFFBFB3|nr:hypothetical protein [Neorhizobium xiangyangii]MCB5205398.1 hypothetical protein [Neorhizobium xiangyangii]
MKQIVYQWRPGAGSEVAALARMRDTFPRPSSLMGEAWFMGEKRHMFTDLMGDLDTLPVNALHKALEEIASGTSSFGPREEWRDWFHYLLPHLVPRATERYVSALSETLVTAFMTQYPCGVVDPPYPQFREDALNTLGRAMMNPACWHDGRIVNGTLLHRTKWPNGHWGWHDASGDLSASMFFNLKYLSPEEIPAWIASVLAIACPYWRAQLLVWFVGAHDLLEGCIEDPSGLPHRGPKIDWNWAHCLKMGNLAPGDPAPFFPRANCQTMLEGLTKIMNEDLLLQWLMTIAEVPELETELLALPSRFEELYL